MDTECRHLHHADSDDVASSRSWRASATLASAHAAPRGLPDWEELRRHTVKHSPDFVAGVERLRTSPPKWRYRAAKVFVKRILRDSCYTKFLNCDWSEIVDVMADQVVRNREIVHEDNKAVSSPPLALRAGNRIIRPYGQMPCTMATTRRRVDMALSLVDKDVPILLLGDDDLVSVELAAAGYRDVTALDIDPKVLDEIKGRADTMGLNIHLHQHDLSQPPPGAIRRPYGLVLFDSEYTVPGFRLFLDAALALTEGYPTPLIFANVHLMSLLKSGLSELSRVLEDRGLEIQEFHQGFNVYPTPASLKGLIHLVNRIVIGSNMLTTEGHAFPYLLSDALLLRKIS